MEINTCHFGDCRDVMKRMLEAGIRAQTCVTSPPYYGLRDYDVSGQIGLEATLAEYIDNIVEVFRCVRDVLADDGTVWMNIGDSYAGNGMMGKQALNRLGERLGTGGGHKHSATKTGRSPTPAGLKPKDLIGVPWRVAFALQADGWFLRQGYYLEQAESDAGKYQRSLHQVA